MTHTVTLIPGDGIGPEISDAMVRVVEACGVAIAWESVTAGEAAFEKSGTPLPPEVIASIKKNRVAIKGPTATPIGTGFRSINVALRKELDLYANVRPAVSIPGTGARYEDVDVLIVRENTEDLYAGIEFGEGSDAAAELIDWVARKGSGKIRPDSGISIKPISISGSERIVRYAFEYALANNRRRVCAVHKANIMKDSDGLFLEVARRVAAEYTDRIEFEDRIVDATCMQMVLDPADFDVLVLPNLYGDIVSDLAAGLIGGLGMAPGANIGSEYAIFEAVHGTAPLIAGQGIANPTALILSAAQMLRHLGEQQAAARIERAVQAVYRAGATLTGDIVKTRTGSTKGAASTQEFTTAVIAAL